MIAKIPRRLRRGITIVELTLVSLIIGILAATAVPRYSDSLARYRVKASARRVAADLNYAQQEAMNRGVEVKVSFDIPNQQYTLVNLPDPLGYSDSYVVDLKNTDYPIESIDVGFGPMFEKSVTFDRYGRVVIGGAVKVTAGGISQMIFVDTVTSLTTTD